MQSTLVWQHPAFGDLFGRPLAASHYSEGAAQKSPALLKQLTSAFSNISLGSVTSVALSPSDAEEPPSTASKCLSTLVAALDFVAGMLPSSEAAAQAALRECSGLATHIADVSTIPPADATSRCRIVEAVVSRVRDLGSSGGIMCVPIGWEHGAGVGGHVLLLVLSCAEPGGDITVSVCNAGAGCRYHPHRPDTSTAALLLMLPLRIGDVPKDRLASSTWWFLVLRPLLWADASHGPAALYEQLLPHLTRRPVLASVASDGHSRGDDDDNEWLPTPASTDGGAGLVMQALSAMWRDAGRLPRAERGRRSLCVQLAILQRAEAQLSGLRSPLPAAEAALIRLACRQLANLAAQLVSAGDDEATGAATSTLELIERLSGTLRHANVRDAPPTLSISPGAEAGAHSTRFPLFGWLRHDLQSVDVGSERVPPIVRPVQLSLVPDGVSCYADAQNALRHGARLCSTISHQADRIQNSAALRVALIQHIFTHALPAPLPPSPSGPTAACFWQREPIRYETQLDLLRLLQHIHSHFLTATFSTRPTVLSDAARLLTLACIAAIADALARRTACDVPSLFSLHYSGDAPGPGRPFGFDVGTFREESEQLRFHDAYLLQRRTEVLDYFNGVQTLLGADEAARASQTLFSFEASMVCGLAERRLLRQLAWQVGYPQHGFPEVEGHESEHAALKAPQIWRYLTGEARELLDDWPELEALRDIAFFWKAAMAPKDADLPEARPWHVSEALLSWSSTKEGLLQVSTFGRVLKCAYAATPSTPSSASSPRRGRTSRFGVFRGLLGGSKGAPPRVPLSAADPSVLADADIQTEDDVLHLKELPSFNARLSPMESEYLLQLLTAPYLRIPMLADFLSPQHRVTLLAEPSIQEVLDASLFEPGLWQPDAPRAAPAELPASDRQCFATPCGLLVNELQCAPRHLLESLLSIAKNALDLDSGKFGAGAPHAILYVVRLLVRVEGHILLVLSKNATARGTHATEPALDVLPGLHRELRELLWDGFFPAVSRHHHKHRHVEHAHAHAPATHSSTLTHRCCLCECANSSSVGPTAPSPRVTRRLRASSLPIKPCFAHTCHLPGSTFGWSPLSSSPNSSSPTFTRGTSTQSQRWATLRPELRSPPWRLTSCC